MQPSVTFIPYTYSLRLDPEEMDPAKSRFIDSLLAKRSASQPAESLPQTEPTAVPQAAMAEGSHPAVVGSLLLPRCAHCGKQIPAARLAMVPQTNACSEPCREVRGRELRNAWRRKHLAAKAGAK